MKQYTPEKIRNVAVMGHGNAGKTSLVEAILWCKGQSDRLGKVDNGTSVSDYTEEEIKRGTSVFSSVVPVEVVRGGDERKINMVDAPGLFDYEGAQCEAMSACESVLIVVSGKSGMSVGAEKAYKSAVKNGKSRMVYVSKMDRPSADFYKVLEELKSAFGPSVCPVVVPCRDGDRNIYINLITDKAYTYDAGGNPSEVPVPDMEHRLEGLRSAMSEAVAEADEELFEKFFSGEQFTEEELRRGVQQGVKDGAITPVICGSALMLEAVDLTADMMAHLLPSAAHDESSGVEDESGEPVSLPCDPAGDPVAYVFKTVNDPFVGRLSFVKVLSGKLTGDLKLYNGTRGEAVKMGKMVYLCGKKQIDTKELPAGDIGAVTKLSGVFTGDTLCREGKVYKVLAPSFPIPTYAMAVQPVDKGDESKIGQGILKLCEEDQTLHFATDKETKQQVLTGMGEQHLDVVISRLKSKYGVDAKLEKPMVAYREAIGKKVKVEGKYKKQTGGHGQYGHVWIEFEPCDGEGLVFEEKVFGGAVPKNYFPAVEKGLQESIQHGVVAGYPVVGLKATLLDGSYHPVDSSELAFKTAASLAYKEGIKQAGAYLLEPIGTLNALVPEQNTGDIMGEVNKRRGRVLGMDPQDGGYTEIVAEIPMAEMSDFTTTMRQTTQGRGSFTFVFTRYEPLPPQLEAKVVEEAKKFFE
ncbi:elongation factor G [Neobittarella massiliensis]|uniref:Elongation factor G n=1 Tax=Neobittarella massiliensis (ex Bilen et al. 2018) TaxID=2041842 RepID=A0A8J6IK87_9FIRM|nr:elongation factor G [Neobittarella massiliensis]